MLSTSAADRPPVVGEVLEGRPAGPSPPEAEMTRLRANCARLAEANVQLVARMGEATAELQRSIESHPRASLILKGVPGLTPRSSAGAEGSSGHSSGPAAAAPAAAAGAAQAAAPAGSGPMGGVRGKFMRFVDEVTEKRDWREEAEVLRARLAQLQAGDAAIAALQVGLEVCQGDYAAAVHAKDAAERRAQRAEEEASLLRASLAAYEGDAADGGSAAARDNTGSGSDLDEIFGEELAALSRKSEPTPPSAQHGVHDAAMKPRAGPRVAAVVATLRDRVAQLEAELAARDTASEKATAAGDAQRVAVDALERALEEAELERSTLREREALILQANERLEAHIKRLLPVVNSTKEVEADLRAARERVAELEKRVAGLVSELEVERSSAHSGASATLTLRREADDLRKQLALAHQEASTAAITIETLEDQQEQLDATRARLLKVSGEMLALRAAHESAAAEIAAADRRSRTATKMLHIAGPRLARTATRLQILLAAEAQCRGFLEAERDDIAAQLRRADSERASALAQLSNFQSGEAAREADIAEATREAQLELRRVRGSNAELRRTIMVLERELREARDQVRSIGAVQSCQGEGETADTAAVGVGSGTAASHIRASTPEPASSNGTPSSRSQQLEFHHRSASMISVESVPSTKGAQTHETPRRVPSFTERVMARISPRKLHAAREEAKGGSNLGPPPQVEQRYDASRIQAMEEELAALRVENERKGNVLTRIIARHPEVMLGPLAPTPDTRKAIASAHPRGFGRLSAGTPQEFHNLQSALERTIIENERLSKDAEVLTAEVGRLSDMLATVTGSTRGGGDGGPHT